MSILIKGMEMPTDCRTCQVKVNCTDCEGWECCCLPLGKKIGDIDELLKDRRRDDCPLVPVPPHGRLGDLDKIERTLHEWESVVWDRNALQMLRDCINLVKATATIIPAEEAAE